MTAADTTVPFDDTDGRRAWRWRAMLRSSLRLMAMLDQPDQGFAIDTV
jgi:hypothetical protein